MADENQAQPQQVSLKSPGEKTWNEQLREWHDSTGLSITKAAKKIGLPRPSFREYIAGLRTDLSRVNPRAKELLYAATGLEIFKTGYESDEARKIGNRKVKKDVYQSQDISIKAREAKQGIDQIAEIIISHLSGLQKLEAGLLKYQQYRPNPIQRADGIMELLDALAEEVDYYRSASPDERKVLVEKLKQNPESFGYATQILNVLYQGKQIDSWMMMAQPPSKIRRIRGERK